MKYVWVAQCSDYLEVFATKKLAEQEMKRQKLVRIDAFWCDPNYKKISEYDIYITKCLVKR